MVEETIKTIKETEREAERLMKEADEKCASILENAGTEADSLKYQSETDAKNKARVILDMEKQAGEKSIQDALAGVEKEISVLKERARAKESDVISEVIAELV